MDKCLRFFLLFGTGFAALSEVINEEGSVIQVDVIQVVQQSRSCELRDLSYLSIFTKINNEDANLNALIAPNGTIPLDQIKLQFGSAIAPYLGTGIVRFINSGIFHLTYHVSGYMTSVGGGIIAIALNGTQIISGTEFVIHVSTVGFGNLMGPTIILNLTKGDTIQIINTDNTYNFTLDAYPNGNSVTPITAFMVVNQLA